MKIQVFFIVLFGINLSISQINKELLYDEWIKVDTRKLDGSKDLTNLGNENIYMEWSFTKSEFCTNSSPIINTFKNCHSLNLNRNIIKINENAYHEISKVTKDTLEVVLRLKHITEPSEISKFVFVKKSFLKQQNLTNYYNVAENTLTAFKFFTPTVSNTKYNSHIIGYDDKKNSEWGNYTFICNFIIFPKLKKTELILLNKEDNLNNMKYFEKYENDYSDSFKNWELKNFIEFDKITVPLIIISKNSEKNKYKKTLYLTNDINDHIEVYKPTLDDIKAYEDNFRYAVFAFNQNEFNNAINFFHKAYIANPKKVDPLYNIVNIHFHLKDIKSACETLKILVHLEQTEGIKLYNEHCLKN